MRSAPLSRPPPHKGALGGVTNWGGTWLAVGWDLSGVYGVEHELVGLPMGLRLAHDVINGF